MWTCENSCLLTDAAMWNYHIAGVLEAIDMQQVPALSAQVHALLSNACGGALG